jgi:hypothetical protein
MVTRPDVATGVPQLVEAVLRDVRRHLEHVDLCGQLDPIGVSTAVECDAEHFGVVEARPRAEDLRQAFVPLDALRPDRHAPEGLQAPRLLYATAAGRGPATVRSVASGAWPALSMST